MSPRTLPTTIRRTLGALRRSMGWAAVVVGVLSLPFVLLAAWVTWPLVWAKRRLAGESPWPRRRTLSIDEEGLAFGWCGDAESARQSLEDAVRLLVESLHELIEGESLESLEIRNPETGFALDSRFLGPVHGDFVDHLTTAFWGSKIEYGELVVNGSTVLAGLDVDVRTATTGHLYVDLSTRSNPQALARRAARMDFAVRGRGAPSPMD